MNRNLLGNLEDETPVVLVQHGNKKQGRGLFILLLMALAMPLVGWGQGIPTITTDANGNGTIEDSEKVLYLIQTNQFQSFYMVDTLSGTKITTNNIPNPHMLWYFLDAGIDGTTQYYYIVSNSANKYICHGGGTANNDNSRAVMLVEKDASNEERCKFKLVVDNSNGTVGFYNIDVKGNPTYYGLNKHNGSVNYANPVRLTNSSYIHDYSSKWKFIPYNGTFTWPDPPFTPSTNSQNYYYKIHNIVNGSYYVSSDASTPKKVTIASTASNNMAWYFIEVDDSDPWIKYYYIVNPEAGEYMYYKGTATDGSNQSNAIILKEKTSENEDRFQFIIVQTARVVNNAPVDGCYTIIPKLLKEQYFKSNSISPTSITDGNPLGIRNGRGVDNNNSHWGIEPTVYPMSCSTPIITYSSETGKITITATPADAEIHYTTDGVTVPSSTVGTLYSEPFAVSSPMTIMAIATKPGCTDSEVATYDLQKVATPTFSLNTSTNVLTITTSTPEASIYYSTGAGSTPETAYSSPFVVPYAQSNQLYRAIAVKEGCITSDIGEQTIKLNCHKPVISFNSNTQQVTLTCADTEATMYYTTNGDTPTTSSTPYNGTGGTGAFTISSACTVKAIAVHTPNYNNSDVEELPIIQVATPTIQNNGNNAISITCATEGATIYYTTDGSGTPDIEYTGPLTEGFSGVTIYAIAVKQNMINSEVGDGLVTLQCETPVITRVDMTFTLSCNLPTDATLLYSLDNSTPATPYNGPVSFTAQELPMTVTAIARHSKYTDSEPATLVLRNGTGTPTDPYLIYGDTDFSDFVTNVNNGTTASACYKLATNVSAIGTNAITTAFTGTFDGDSYTITGLEHPLFDTVNDGTVKNVTLKNVDISSSADAVGAIAGTAKGYSRIYNCGILPNSADFPTGTDSHPSITTSGACAGGIVGRLEDDSRVINCYSYADVSATTTASGIVGYNTFASNAASSGGKYPNLRTAIVNCMFYGNITGGTNQYGVYGGELITNAASNGISSYNYYRYGSTFTASSTYGEGEPTAYNCSFPADERYLTQVEFHRSLLNSNRELCGWWVGSDVAPNTLSTTAVQAIPKDASLIYKWVVDPNLAPYPILKPFGKYPSIVNGNTGTPWFDRTLANPYEGKQLGTLTVTVKSGDHSSATDTTLYLPITDMDTLHYDFGYRKVQLPYYNTVFGNPDGATWTDKYAGNYTDYVVTGWKIVSVNNNDVGESYIFNGNCANPDRLWEDGYNFADRNDKYKDFYAKSGRVFAQGGNYYVPNGVTAITIEAYWGEPIYVRNNESSYDRVNITENNTGSHFAPAGTRDNNVNGATIYTGKIRDVIDNISQKKTVYDYAIVLVGNKQESNSNTTVTNNTDNTRGFTIMSVDLDFDEEPDYCLEWQLGTGVSRNTIAPIRFDFLPVVELGIAGKTHNSTYFLSLGCFRSFGHFEVTETSFIRFGQFEFELGTRDDGPIILNGGIYDQYCRGRNGETNQHITYVILGGHVVMPSFTPGAHVHDGARYQTRHCAVNALGGDFTSFYLTGGYNEKIKPYQDNPHCYIDGGRFGTIAAAYKEGIWGDVTWRINHALIGEFYGGGVMAEATGDYYKIVKGSIDVVIDTSIVQKYCGGPKFGDMMPNETVTTRAHGTIFTRYYGAGNGGTNYVQYDKTDDSQHVPPYDAATWSGIVAPLYHPGQYRSRAQGYEADYDYEVINVSAGTWAGNVINRSYYFSAQFATTNTGDVSSELNGCTVKKNFYGGGFLGGVSGSVTSTLINTDVFGSAFGGGYSASVDTVVIHNIDKNIPVVNVYTGMISYDPCGTSTTYYWSHSHGSTASPATEPSPATHDTAYFYTEEPLNDLGAVSNDVTLIIKGNSTIGTMENGVLKPNTGNVFGGGDESKVLGNITVKLQGKTRVLKDVFAGGNEGAVSGNTSVTIESEPPTPGTPEPEPDPGE